MSQIILAKSFFVNVFSVFVMDVQEKTVKYQNFIGGN